MDANWIKKDSTFNIVRSLVVAFTLCMLLSACSGTKNEEERFIEIGSIQNNTDNKDAEPTKEETAAPEEAIQASVIQEEAKATGISEETESIRALREFYNANCLGKVGKVFFVDLTGDGEEEMIVLEKDADKVDSGSLWQEQKLSLSVYQYVQGDVEERYYALAEKEMFGDMVSATGTNYYLCIKNRKAEIILEQCADSKEQISIEKVSFENSDTAQVSSIAMSQEEFEEKRKSSILLLDSFTAMTPAWDIKQELSSYQHILDGWKEITDLIEIAQTAQEPVLDYSVIFDEDDQCIFAVTGTIRNCQADKEHQAEYYEGLLSVWASYDGQAKKWTMATTQRRKAIGSEVNYIRLERSSIIFL